MVKDIAHKSPPWERGIARLLGHAIARTRLLAAVAPENAKEERARLVAALERGDAEAPRWSYAPLDDPDASARMVHVLNEAADFLAELEAPFSAAYEARTREVLLDVQLTLAVGTPAFAELARERFEAPPGEAREASALTDAWLSEPTSVGEGARAARGNELASDSDHPAGLVARLREEISRLRIPFDVRVHPQLVSLAATGERTIWVASGRPMSVDDVERTVVHEVFGHALPRVRAAALPCPLFRLGTRRGADEQEGFALSLEARHGLLGASRRRELALRQAAVAFMDGGASFAETTRFLLRDHGLTPTRSVMVAERVYRGGHRGGPGLGRERVYLPAFLRVSALLDRTPAAARVLASGQVATEWVGLLSPLVAQAEH